jgi:hypothetical protein
MRNVVRDDTAQLNHEWRMNVCKWTNDFDGTRLARWPRVKRQAWRNGCRSFSSSWRRTRARCWPTSGSLLTQTTLRNMSRTALLPCETLVFLRRMNEENSPHSRDNVWQWGSFVRPNHESLKIKLHATWLRLKCFFSLVFADMDNQEIRNL